MSLEAKTEKQKKSVYVSKGIILLFFAIFLVIYGIVITNLMNRLQDEGSSIPLYVNYLPFLFYVVAIFLVFGFIILIKNATSRQTLERRSRGEFKISTVYKRALFIAIFIFAFVPLFSPIIDQGRNEQEFSVYNNNPASPNWWKGGSEFKRALDEAGYETGCVQSSLSATQRIPDKKILLILLGPNQFYNPSFEIPYFIEFFNQTNSLLICHDHGTTSTLLWEIFLASTFSQEIIIPVTIFPDGILRDNQSYVKTPEFPLIQNFRSHSITSGIDNVVLSKASAPIGGPFIETFGWTPLAYTSFYSYIDKNDDHMYNIEDDNVDLSFISNMVEQFPEALLKFPLGGYPQTPFMVKDSPKTRVFVSGDASMFNNELINAPGYDNKQFALNVVNWLTRGEDKDEWLLVFDEAHIRPEYSRDLSSAGIFGFIIQYVVHLSTNPITQWIYPVLAYFSLEKYLPSKKKKQKKEEKEAEKEEEKLRFRTSSYFAEKIQYYKNKRKYHKALILLYRRMERKLNVLIKDKRITTENVIKMIKAKEPNVNKSKLKRIAQFMDTIIPIKKGKSKVRTESEFERLFFEMEWAINNL
ncbi:MAG: conserved membrane protein of unknown function [Promethearchaeota archaeon]|nr:MAG: conserved membrane protein of unknown function [Candidatus Lokiarchaeota archaeon]